MLQNVFYSIHVSQASSAVWQLFADALTGSIAPAKWQYALVLKACLAMDMSGSALSLSELHTTLQRLYPRAGDDEVQKLLLRFRDAGLVRLRLHCRACVTMPQALISILMD